MKENENDIQNIEFYQSFSALTQKSLEIITMSAEKNLVVRPVRIWIKQEDDTYARREINRPWWDYLLNNLKDEIENTEEFKRFYSIAEVDKIIFSQLNTLVGTGFGRIRLELFNIAIMPIYRFLTDDKIIDFDDNIFKSEYLNLEKSLYSSEIEIEATTPLSGFYADVNEIKLSDRLTIVKLSESEIIELLRLRINIGMGFGPDNIILLKHQFAIKRTFSMPKLIGDKDILERIETVQPHGDRDQEQKVLNALRIFKIGKVHILGTVTKSLSIFIAGVNYNSGLPIKPSVHITYQLDKNEITNFLEFWRAYRGIKISEKHFLSVAIRRFSQSNERESIEDKIIDLMISAEAIFLSSGGSFQGELKYRLSHRAAMFIEDSTEKQKIIFKIMQQAYDVRSAIIHGTKPKLPKKDDGTLQSLSEFSNDIEKLLRYSIKKLIELAKTAKTTSKILDWDKIIFPKPPN